MIVHVQYDPYAMVEWLDLLATADRSVGRSVGYWWARRLAADHTLDSTGGRPRGRSAHGNAQLTPGPAPQ